MKIILNKNLNSEFCKSIYNISKLIQIVYKMRKYDKKIIYNDIDIKAENIIYIIISLYKNQIFFYHFIINFIIIYHLSFYRFQKFIK